jgi:hypothetical protein
MAVSKTKTTKPVRKASPAPVVEAVKAAPAASVRPAAAAKPASVAASTPAVKLGSVPKAVVAKVQPPKAENVPVSVPVAPQAAEVALKAAAAPTITPIVTPVAVAAEPKKDIIMTDTVKKIEDTIKTTAAQTSEKATEMFSDMQGRAKAAFEKSGDVMKDVVEFHKANLEAVVESGKLAAKGTQTAMQNGVDFSKKNWEATTAHVKTVSGLRAPADFVKAQSEFARSQMDSMVTEFTKSSEFTMKMLGEVMQPIQNRAAAVADQMKSRMAA